MSVCVRGRGACGEREREREKKRKKRARKGERALSLKSQFYQLFILQVLISLGGASSPGLSVLTIFQRTLLLCPQVK